MKVLDLQCALGHAFEGWFASEDDFVAQCDGLQVQCPVCGDASIVKKLSAPRLNLGGKRVETEEPPASHSVVTTAAPDDHTLSAAWAALARQVVANTTDVGSRFAEEARKIHYGEVPEHGIRGRTTVEQARSLMDEGIEILPFVMPDYLKKPLQ